MAGGWRVIRSGRGVGPEEATRDGGGADAVGHGEGDLVGPVAGDVAAIEAHHKPAELISIFDPSGRQARLRPA